MFAVCLSVLFGLPALLTAYIGSQTVPVAPSPNQPSGQMPGDFDGGVVQVVAEIEPSETHTLLDMNRTALDRQGQMRTLGRLLLFDKHLPVSHNQACSFCHMPETGPTGRK